MNIITAYYSSPAVFIGCFVRCFFLTVLLAIGADVGAAVQQQYNFPTNPKERGQDFFVVNANGIINSSTEAKLNDLAVDIERQTGAEYAIVVMDDFDGYELFDYALALFNSWGIGKKESNNGLLLVVAKNRRAYRFISGYGMERIFPDVYLHRIGERYLVPSFREENYDKGLLEASELIRQVLTAPDVKAELERMLPGEAPFFSLRNSILINCLLLLVVFPIAYVWIFYAGRRYGHPNRKSSLTGEPVALGLAIMLGLMFLSLFIFVFVFDNLGEVYQRKNIPYFVALLGTLILTVQYYSVRKALLDSYNDEATRQKALRSFLMLCALPMLLAPVVWLTLYQSMRRYANLQERLTPPDDSGDWKRVNRDEFFPKRKKMPGRTEIAKKLKPYLSEGQMEEERWKGRTYEIWQNTKTNAVKIIPWEGTARNIQVCPTCNFKTYRQSLTHTIREPSYTREGKKERYNLCEHCGLRESVMIYTLAKLSKSSSGGSSGGGGRSSGGGSFGGGSSGGGGAGGRW